MTDHNDLQQHLEDEGLLEWNKLLQTASYVPEMGLSSQRIGPALSVQCDSENDTALLASNDAQILLSAEEQECLLRILEARRDARYAAKHKAFYSKYI